MTEVAIQLPDDLSQFVKESVQAGDYPNADELFASVLSMYKVQMETRLSAEDQAKIDSLRSDIQLAVDQAARGEVIPGFDIESFLTARHAVHATSQNS